MSQPITHYFIAREALRNSDLWHDYAPYITLGTLGPDLFYLCNPVTAMGLNKLAKYSDVVEDLDSKQKVYENLADAIHSIWYLVRPPISTVMMSWCNGEQKNKLPLQWVFTPMLSRIASFTPWFTG